MKRTPAQPAEDLLTVEETARLLHLNVKRVQALARSGKLPALRTGRRWLFRRSEVLASMRGSAAAQTSVAHDQPAIDISARNQLRGRIERLIVEGLMADVHIAVGDQTLVALITRSSAQRLGLKQGMTVLAVVKSTEVMVALEAG